MGGRLPSILFQPTPPAREATAAVVLSMDGTGRFQPTPPAREATRRMRPPAATG